MKIVVINGTEIKGVTYRIKECFLGELREGNEIVEFDLPTALPNFCRGCKTCFFKGETLCPDAAYTTPIWDAMLSADLLVFSYPVYALRTTAQMKCLLDHFCVHWMVHRPDARMFSKRAAILTNSIGAPNGAAQRDVKTSLHWLGVSSVRCLGCGLMEGVIWSELSEKRHETIERKTRAFARSFRVCEPARKGLRVRLFFAMCKILHQLTAKTENPPSLDNQYWIDRGWIQRKTKER